MCVSIREDFGRIRMGQHRTELIQRLDQVLERLDLGFVYLNQHNPYLEEHDLAAMQAQYAALRAILLEVDEEMKTLSGAYPGFYPFQPADSCGHAQSTTRPSCVHCLYAGDGFGGATSGRSVGPPIGMPEPLFDRSHICEW